MVSREHILLSFMLTRNILNNELIKTLHVLNLINPHDGQKQSPYSNKSK